MPCPFIGPKMFRAGPNFFSNPKSLFTYFASHKHFVPDKKMICIQQNCFLCQHKSFWRSTKCSQIFGLAQKIWTGTKRFGTCKRTRHYCNFSRPICRWQRNCSISPSQKRDLTHFLISNHLEKYFKNHLNYGEYIWHFLKPWARHFFSPFEMCTILQWVWTIHHTALCLWNLLYRPLYNLERAIKEGQGFKARLLKIVIDFELLCFGSL